LLLQAAVVIVVLVLSSVEASAWSSRGDAAAGAVVIVVLVLSSLEALVW
jgi:hypothetical protein